MSDPPQEYGRRTVGVRHLRGDGPLDPYTTGELAGRVGAAREVVRKLLDALYQGGQVERQESSSGALI